MVHTPESDATPSVAPPDVSGLTTDQRIARLEQQINNLVVMNLPARLDALQLEIEKLNGQHEQDAHDLKALSDQLRDFYADLTRRIGGAPPANHIGDTAANHGGKDAVNHDSKGDNNGSSLESQSSTLAPAPSATASPDPDQQSVPKEQKMYESALNLLQQKKYAAAADKMADYLKDYPTGAYVVNAHYWVGESHYLLNQYDQAAVEFKLLLDKYPNSTKTQDAMLKLAIIHDNKGDHELAKKEFSQVVKRFPGSTAAQIAKQHLAQ